MNYEFKVDYLNKDRRTLYTKKYRYNSIKEEEKRNILKLQNSSLVEIYCCCFKKVKQRIKTNLVIYNAKNNELHNHNCCRYKLYSNQAEYVSGWKEEDNGNYIIHLKKQSQKTNIENDFKILGMDNDLTSDQYNNENQPIISLTHINEKQKGNVTVLGLITRLNLMVWEEFAEKGDYPDNPYKMLRKIYGFLGKIYLQKNAQSLQNLVITKKENKIEKAQSQNIEFFFYLLFDKVEEKVYENGAVKYFIHATYKFNDDPNKKPNSYRFYLSEHDYLRIKEETVNISFNYMIGGFLKATRRSSIFDCYLIEVFKVTKNGLYCESSYEKEVYEYLVDQNRKFYKPYYCMIDYNNYIPDLFFIDQDPPIIGEIFGLNTEEYLEKRSLKIEWAKKNSHIFGFQYWDAYTGISHIEGWKSIIEQ